jgi:transposase
LRQSGLAQLVVLGDTLHSWSEEIARMWRFTRSGQQAYGFRNFENYRLRVKVLCS